MCVATLCALKDLQQGFHWDRWRKWRSRGWTAWPTPSLPSSGIPITLIAKYRLRKRCFSREEKEEANGQDPAAILSGQLADLNVEVKAKAAATLPVDLDFPTEGEPFCHFLSMRGARLSKGPV